MGLKLELSWESNGVRDNHFAKPCTRISSHTRFVLLPSQRGRNLFNYLLKMSGMALPRPRSPFLLAALGCGWLTCGHIIQCSVQILWLVCPISQPSLSYFTT